MGQPARKHRLSYQDYLALERETDLRHEFLDGEAWAMAGGTLRHSALKVNLGGLMFVALRGRPCRAYDADAKTIVPDTGLATYADLAVLCGPPEPAPHDRHALTNPVVLFEVLSPSTEAWDRGGKFHHYRHLGSLQHYVLLTTEQPRVEVFTRGEGGSWILRTYGPGDRVALPAIEVELSVDELYADLPEEPVEEEAAAVEG